MSTRREEFVIIGVDINHLMNDDFYDAHEDYMRKKPAKEELFILYDGMNGQYCILGEVLAQGDEFEGLPLFQLDQKEQNKIKKRVKEKVFKEFKIEIEPKIYIVTHWH